MGKKTKSGIKARVETSIRGVEVNTAVPIDPNVWFEVHTVGAASALPAGVVEGSVFKSPDTSATAITLAAGDAVWPLTLDNICKTDATIEAEEGIIDVTDDCEQGYNAIILDGFVDIKGTLGGFIKFDDATGVIKDDSLNPLKRFFDYWTDDGEGVYVYTPKANEKTILFLCLNKDAILTEKQNWLILPVQFSSISTGAGLKDAQKRDLNWAKAQGPACIYARTAFTDDLL